MSKHRSMIGAAALLVAAWSGDAAAASDSDLALFGRNPGGGRAFACYTRHYDVAHLKSHPRQNTVDMTLFVNSYVEADSGRQYLLSIGVHFRPAPALFHLDGGCGKPEDGKAALGCGIDCDGGVIDIKVRDANSILVSIPDGAATWDPTSEEEPPENSRFGLDDKVFRLDRTDVAECLPLVSDAEVRAAILDGK